MQKKFWVGKTVLVTGSEGFVGSHLVAFLTSQGARVVGITREATRRSVAADVTSKKALTAVFRKYTPQYCFHLAAIATVEAGTTNPVRTFEENITGALNVLELSRQHNLTRVIIASTAHVYGDGEGLFREEDPPRPTRPYETSKTCVDLIAQSYADTFHLPVLIPRFVNIYGPGDKNRERIIPKTITALLARKNPTMWGGAAIREYLYVDDAIAAYDLLAKLSDDKVEKNRIYNFGSRDAVSVRELITRIIELTGVSLPIEKIPDARPDEIINQKVSWAKAKRILNWDPQVAMGVGLQKTIEWWRNND